MALYTIQLKRGKSSSWNSLNPILNPGEPGFEIDTGKLKIGNGVNSWRNLSYVGDSKRLIVNAKTVFDFPLIGEVDVIYKASQEKRLYQWNEDLQDYEVFLRNDYITENELQEILDKIEIPEIQLEDYATKDYEYSIINTLISLSDEEILEICK